MLKKTFIFLLFTILILTGCSNKLEKHSNNFFSFDTVVTLDGYTASEEEFAKYFASAKNEFDRYHKLFDAYHEYREINNIKTINDNAGIKPVQVDSEVYDVIKKSIELNKTLPSKNNIALAPVIIEYKKEIDNYMDKGVASNPKMSVLKEKAKCTNINDIELLKDNKIYLKNKCNAIDVGSVAKGYAAQYVAKKIEKEGLKSGILNAGGNIVVIGSKPDGTDFNIGIANPENRNDYFAKVAVNNTNVVTSGDYERYYEIDGVKYHHIIDPDTLKPANKYLSFTVIMDDGFLADYFSTECFMLDKATIDKLAKEYKFEYIAMKNDKKIIMSQGIEHEVQTK